MRLQWVALAFLSATAQAAGTVSCPDLSDAAQVATCPSEAELRYTFTGYCSDAARMYDKDPACADEKAYRQKKNVALWESRDGAFQGYVSCAPARRGEGDACIINCPHGQVIWSLIDFAQIMRFYYGLHDVSPSARKA